MDKAFGERPWRTVGFVLLPDHWHALWHLPEGDSDYSWRIGRIKALFTRAYLTAGGDHGQPTASQRRNRRQAVWQPRFLEHTIRDARDFWKHLNYIHINPVKHGLVARPADWPWSTFHKWAKMGYYEVDWAGQGELPGFTHYDWPDVGHAGS
jgi:putative transposase